MAATSSSSARKSSAGSGKEKGFLDKHADKGTKGSIARGAGDAAATNKTGNSRTNNLADTSNKSSRDSWRGRDGDGRRGRDGDGRRGRDRDGRRGRDWDDDDHHHHGHHHSFFFLSIGSPFWGFGYYDPYWWGGYWGPGYYGNYPGFGFSYWGGHWGIGYSGYAWPYWYGYDPCCVYPAGVGYYDYDYDPPVYAAAPTYDPPARTDATAIATEPARPRAAAAYNPDGAPPANPAASIADSSSPFVRQGEEAFKARDYKTAVRHWRHALVDEPKHGTLVMMLAQAHFAAGEYDEAAGATQAAMALMPPEKWGVVVENYTELYSDSQDYVDQLQALEKAIKEDAKNPALRFIVGFHYGYLGYPVEAVRELDKLLELAPKDQAGRKLRDLMAEGAKKKNPAGAEPPPEPKPPE